MIHKLKKAISLDPWLSQFFDEFAEGCGMSYSEALRIMATLGIIYLGETKNQKIKKAICDPDNDPSLIKELSDLKYKAYTYTTALQKEIHVLK